jgi:hypothetical protein
MNFDLAFMNEILRVLYMVGLYVFHTRFSLQPRAEMSSWRMHIKFGLGASSCPHKLIYPFFSLIAKLNVSSLSDCFGDYHLSSGTIELVSSIFGHT